MEAAALQTISLRATKTYFCFFFFFKSGYVAIMDRKSSQFFHIMSWTKLKSAGPLLLALLWRLCFFVRKLDLAPCPFPFSSFLWVDRLLWLSVIFKHKGVHLKRLNANLISYMKQSWFIFPELFFLSLQTTSQRTPHTPLTHYPPPPGWNHAFQHPVKGMGKRSVDSCHDPPAPNPLPPSQPTTLFPFPPVDICPQQVPRRAQR